MQHATRNLQEIARRPSPAPRVQPIALHGGLLWMGSWDNNRIYGVDPQSWTVKEDVAAPGQPFGIAPLGETLHVVVSLGETTTIATCTASFPDAVSMRIVRRRVPT